MTPEEKLIYYELLYQKYDAIANDYVSQTDETRLFYGRQARKTKLKIEALKATMQILVTKDL